MTRFRLTTYSTFLTVGTTMPVNLTSPTPSARPLPGAPSQPRKKPEHLPQGIKAEAARHDRIALEMRQEKNQRSGLTSSSATIWPLPYSPPSSEIWVMRSNISIGGKRQLGVARTEQFAPAAGEQIIVKKTRFPFGHLVPLSRSADSSADTATSFLTYRSAGFKAGRFGHQNTAF